MNVVLPYPGIKLALTENGNGVRFKHA